MGAAIEVVDIRKSYGDFEAVRGISFSVDEGSFFAFLGPNGAGKSTTISMLCSFFAPDAGTIRIFGKTPDEARSAIGIVFQDSLLDKRLTVRENLMLRGAMYGYKGADLKGRVEKAMARGDSLEFADRVYSQLSGGQRRRADISRALLHEPKLLLLDEPTTGLDPQSRKLIWKNIHNLRDEGMTVFLTTHYMEEAAEADDVIILKGGEIVAHGTPMNLKDEYSSDYIAIQAKDGARIQTILEENGIPYRMFGDSYKVMLSNTTDAVPIIDLLRDEIESFEVRTGTMDDAFLNIIGGEME